MRIDPTVHMNSTASSASATTLPRVPQRADHRTEAARALRELAVAYSSIVFLNKPWLGATLMLATFVEPDIAWCGCIGLASSWVLLRVLDVRTASFRSFVLYNCLLTGLFMGYIFQLDWKVAMLTVAASALCLTLTAAIDSVLHFYELPVLSLPFTLSALLLSLARPQLSNLGESSPYHIGHLLPVPDVINSALKCLGSLFCTPDPLFGAIMLGLLALASPLTGLFFVGGFFMGHELEAALRLGQPWTHMMHQFNYSLTFTAVSLVFLPPSPKSILLGLVTVVMTSLISLGSATYWEVFHVPMVPFAFNVTVLVILRAARWTLPGGARSSYAGSPEATLDNSRLFRLRQRSGEIGIFCPFAGKWAVQQGFDGPWTHRGHWRHALDFVQHGADGKTFAHRGFDLTDYHCFAKPVQSPVDGVVIATSADQEDNPIGTVDNHRNWGNHVIVRSFAGFYVLLAHLKKDSVLVKTGETVSAGKSLALCGNSGYSQEPHLHLQVQWYPVLGGYTVPFHLLNFQQEDAVTFRGLPQAGAVIQPLPVNVALDRALNFRIGERLRFKRLDLGAREEELRVELDEGTGTSYLASDSGRLSFGRTGSSLFFHSFSGSVESPLADLYRSAPRLPLTYGDPVTFSDALPLRFHRSRAGALGRGAVLIRELLRVPGRSLTQPYRFDPRSLELRGGHTLLKLDPIQGIIYFEANGRKYERIT